MSKFHPQTDDIINSLKNSSWHAILLASQKGIDLTSITEAIYQPTTNVSTIVPDQAKATPIISVETIRELYEQTRGKSIGDQYIVIHEADTMSHAAQTAFLKLLEEPGESIRFILTSHHQERLLPTVRSRLQQHVIQPFTTEQSEAFLASLGVKDPTKLAQLRFIAEGLPDELERLVQDEEYFATASSLVSDAKKLLSATPYEKLRIVHSYREDRAKAQQLIGSAINIVRKSISAKPSNELILQLERLLEADRRLQANGGVRLTLAHLVLQ